MSIRLENILFGVLEIGARAVGGILCGAVLSEYSINKLTQEVKHGLYHLNGIPHRKERLNDPYYSIWGFNYFGYRRID